MKIKTHRLLMGALLMLFGAFHCMQAAVTLEKCVEAARENYPLVKKYSLLEQMKDIDLADIDRMWLPKIGVYAQATGQNTVPSYPEVLSNMLSQMGQQVSGLDKFQYKIGVDVSQQIWDGGASSALREQSRAKEALDQASLDVELYALRDRVESIYFAALLAECQISQSLIIEDVLRAILDRLQAMLRNGVAMQSDCDMAEAQLLVLRQNIESARYQLKGLKRILGLYTGLHLEDEALAKPEPSVELSDAEAEIQRPELVLFRRRAEVNALADRFTRVSLMPKLGFFAQAYYGYPGFDYFKSMMSRRLSFNIMAGVKLTWNVDALYSRSDNLHKTRLAQIDLATDEEIFEFKTRLASESQRESIEGLRSVIKDDARIVELRAGVRKAAESQLTNGVIEATSLLTKIADENQALLSASLHEIQYLKEIYKLKYILNR